MSKIGFIKNKEEKNFLLSTNDKYICKFNNIPFTYDNASMNTIIIGATGSGKTKGIILPILEGLLKDNLPGLIIDIKNDFTNDIYKLAKLYNREKDIIEIGDYETSMNINLLNKVSKEEIIDLLSNIIINSNIEDKENYWLLQGLSLFEDLINIYYYIYEELKDNEYFKNLIEKPSLYILIECFMNEKKAQNLFNLFDKLYKHTYLYKDIKNKIEQYKFHIFNNDNSSTKQEQLSWTRGKIIMLFKKFTEGKNIEKYSNINNNNFILNFSDLLYKQNKIIILRFNLLNNNISNLISSFIKKKMIHDIVKYNANIKEDLRKESFIIMDEFQNIISLKGSYNDNDWFDKSRSFKCYQFIATQSLSSLYSKSENIYEIKTLINNCRNKIFLNTDDTESNNYIKEILEKIPLNNSENKSLIELKLGEGIYTFFNKQDMSYYNYLIKTNLNTLKKI